MAMMTMASPASIAWPIFSARSAISTSKPSPPAPIMEDMITMLRASMMTWLTPIISDGLAEGMSTRHSFCRLVHPAISAKSLISGGTLFSPSSVARTMGGVAKRPVASSADTGLDP